MSIFEYKGSALVAMVGTYCFAIASDRRLGVQLQTIATDFKRIYNIHPKLFIGLSVLLAMLKLCINVSSSTSNSMSFAKRPVIAGLGDDDKPFICTMDAIGAKELAKDFVVAAEELFETISQALLSSVDRDCLSGWGGHVYVVTPMEVTEKILKGRMD
ncbi:protease [Lithospermum erythrorhizon]|uniref:Protease n=1 Tax=Lithospermum erythrorhizon TaxID=34254 RepID=A0AAV3PLR8_LITER